MSNNTMRDIVNLCQNRGFVYPGSDIYGGLANSWDYGPYGSLLKENIKKLWLKEFIQKRKDVMLIDASIIMNPSVWKASGHADGFSDPLMDCKSCHERFRADKLVDAAIDSGASKPDNYNGDKTDSTELKEIVDSLGITCPNCQSQDFSDIKRFNLMLQTQLGVVEDSSSKAYLRPETAQGQFVDFIHVARSSRRKLPFGIAQVGKSFRNEITPGNFIFRTREFEQMEIEYFVTPGDDSEAFSMWKSESEKFFIEILGLKKENIRYVEIPKGELPHYSKEAGDFEFLFPFGWGEVETLANRTDYDLKNHMQHSKQNLSYFDPVNNTRFLPYVIEPAMGLSRLVLATICDSYISSEERTYLQLDPKIAPITIGVLPVVKKLHSEASKIYDLLSEHFVCEYDDVGSIGKRYARFDEIGTPFCVTIDSENYENNMITLRYRDSMEQVLISVDDLVETIKKQI